MAYCKNCGNYCGDGDCKFCPNCGTTMGEQQTSPEKQKTEINKFAKIYLVIALLVTAVVVSLFVGKSLAKKDLKESETTEASQVVTTTEKEVLTEEESKDATVKETVKESVSVSQEIVVVTVPVQQSYYPVTGWSWDYSNPDVRNITYDTPAHAGVKLRVSPTDESAYSMVLSEGTKVIRVNAANETVNDKYIKVVALVNGNTYIGYVMQRYVSSFSGVAYSRRVAYNTPSHAGLVLRAGSSGYSEKLMVIPEGTSLRLLDSSTGAYWKVEALYNGGVYTGYVLSTYIEYVG